MSGGLRHHSDEATGPESWGWIKRHRRNIATISNNQCQRAEGKLCPRLQKQSSMYLDSADVVRDVEKLQFLRNSRNLGDRKCLGKPGKSFVGLRRAEFFDQFWETEFFNSHACYRQSTRAAQCRRSVAVRIVGSLVVRVLGRFLRKRGEF
jgi:hypothetical protein